MTAIELIHELKKLPYETKIIIRGYEDGYNDILKLEERQIIPHRHQVEWYYGEYEDVMKDDDKLKAIKAVELWGKNTKAEEGY
jgi:hypothetical protein